MWVIPTASSVDAWECFVEESSADINSMNSERLVGKIEISRRDVIKGMAATALAPAVLRVAAAAQQKPWWLGDGMPQEGPGTPKIAMQINGNNITEEALRGFVQIGVYHAYSGGPAIPWRTEDLRAMVEKFKAGGVTLGNLMIYGFPNTIYGRPGRDEEIEKIRQSIQAAGPSRYSCSRVQLLRSSSHRGLL